MPPRLAVLVLLILVYFSGVVKHETEDVYLVIYEFL